MDADEQHNLLLARAAERAAARDFFMSAALRQFRELRSMSERELATFLGCLPSTLQRVALCRRPNASGLRFREETRIIAERFHLNAALLAQLLKEVGALQAMQESQPSAGLSADAGWLMAARDKDNEEDKDLGGREVDEET